MKYSAVHCIFDNSTGFAADILAAELGSIGFESFENTEKGLDAYIPSTIFDQEQFIQTISDFPFEIDITYTVEMLEDKNWNEEWEKYFFEPIIINDECVIHSSFHKNFPKLKYDITIDPKMAFGTGHHETTSLMISEVLNTNLINKTVLDMGCGTSVLAILASMRGAKDITAIDIDNWCTENSQENITLNHAKNIHVQLGGAELLQGLHFDIILANINRNILLNDMKSYISCLDKNGELYMSGFYTEDIPIIEKRANELGLGMEYFKQKNNWAVVKMRKQL